MTVRLGDTFYVGIVTDSVNSPFPVKKGIVKTIGLSDRSFGVLCDGQRYHFDAHHAPIQTLKDKRDNKALNHFASNETEYRTYMACLAAQVTAGVIKEQGASSYPQTITELKSRPTTCVGVMGELRYAPEEAFSPADTDETASHPQTDEQRRQNMKNTMRPNTFHSIDMSGGTIPSDRVAIMTKDPDDKTMDAIRNAEPSAISGLAISVGGKEAFYMTINNAPVPQELGDADTDKDTDKPTDTDDDVTNVTDGMDILGRIFYVALSFTDRPDMVVEGRVTRTNADGSYTVMTNRRGFTFTQLGLPVPSVSGTDNYRLSTRQEYASYTAEMRMFRRASRITDILSQIGRPTTIAGARLALDAAREKLGWLDDEETREDVQMAIDENK